MRILLLHPHDITSEREPWTVRITSLAGEFVRRGHEVKLIYHLLDSSRPVEEAARRQDYPFETLPFVRYSRTFFRKNRRVREIAAWADVIHFQKCFAQAAIPALYAGYHHRIPVHYDWDDWEWGIWSYHPEEARAGRLIQRMEATLPTLADTVSVSSDFLRRCALQVGVREDKIYEAPVGADLDRFRPDVDGRKAREQYRAAGPLVLYHGQLAGAQFADQVLQVAKTVADRNVAATFMIVGGGEMMGELVRRAEVLGVRRTVVFTGFVAHARVPEFIAAADVCLAPFADNDQVRAKSPLKIVEYLASGKPIVGSAVGEVVTMLSGAGVLCKAGNTDEMAAKVIQLLQDPGARADLSRRARRRAEEKYNWGRTAENLLAAYEASLEEYHRLYGPRRPDLDYRAGPARVATASAAPVAPVAGALARERAGAAGGE
ncbi:MAG: glycosyltransferase family 4 protein [Planctomycetes bacterium]|nr:glycosyltransferase family 4 protein [Planctomycetota bacterium]